jgi:hypothetical protein
MCFYYRVSIDGPDKASPTSQEIPPLGPELPCHAGSSDAYAGQGVVAAIVQVLWRFALASASWSMS